MTGRVTQQGSERGQLPAWSPDAQSAVPTGDSWLPLGWAHRRWARPCLCLGVKGVLCELGNAICRTWHSLGHFIQHLSPCVPSTCYTPDNELVEPFSTGVPPPSPRSQEVIRMAVLLILAGGGTITSPNSWCTGVRLIQDVEWTPRTPGTKSHRDLVSAITVSPTSRIVPGA